VERYGELLAATADAPRVFPVAVGRVLDVLDDPSRTGPADRPGLFRLAVELHRAHRPAGHMPKDAREQAVAAGSWSAYQKQEKAKGLKKTVSSALARHKRTLRTRVMKAAYRADLRTTRLDPDLAVYGAYWNRGVSCNPAAIHAQARRTAPHIKGVFVVSSRHKDRVPDGVPYVIEGSRRYWQTMATATYLINNSSFPGGFTKRPGQVYLQTHHGTPLKKMGLDQRRYPAGTHGISFAKVLAHTDQWDYSLSANPHSTQVWERVYPSAAYAPLELGYPRNDVYFTTEQDRISKIRAELGIADGQRAILYAPTHRDYQKGFLPRLDLARFADALGDDHVVLVRAHYFYGDRAGLADAHPRLRDVTGHHRVEDLCLAADALVTDYSSLMFDYACLDRPIVTYAPDWQAYRLARGTYFDLLSGLPGDTPGAVATTEEELVALFRDGGADTAATTRLRAAFRDRFCAYDDGGAAERVVRKLFLNG
ncbi:CDP-glycerol glycerophosphotransferase family protein, partial [Streptomyces sp. SID14478]|uniref:CDP-glycerol glycerophosphotransferase family protein n=1 Tax=Streptomyces sp. SID14478 TaxID=2706073 RepID=UPI001EF34C70